MYPAELGWECLESSGSGYGPCGTEVNTVQKIGFHTCGEFLYFFSRKIMIYGVSYCVKYFQRKYRYDCILTRRECTKVRGL